MSQASVNKNVFGEPDESTRLLADEERDGHSASGNSQVRDPTPLPLAQLTALGAVQIVMFIAHTQIFPYINHLLADLHIAPPEQVGFYTGFIESAYSLAQVFSVYQWGRLSDIIGRRPIVIFGLICVVATTIAFGLSTSLVVILASRFFGGLVAGNTAVLHSILVEITDDSNQDNAVPIYALSAASGPVVGPLIGGTFANAATRYPKYFSWPIFVVHPHLLPCIISALCTLLAMLLGYTFLEETLPSKRNASDLPSSTPPSASDTDTSTTETRHLSVKTLLAIPALRALTLSGFALGFLGSAFNIVFALFCYTPVDAGGLGLQPSTIGNFLAFAGTVAVFLRLLAMPYILRRFDYAKIYKTCMYLWPVAFTVLPLFNALARARPVPPETSTGTIMTTVDVCIWTGLALVLGLNKVAAMSYSVMVLLIKQHAFAVSTHMGTGSGTMSESKSALGKCNGLVQFAMSIGRTIGPVVVSTLFATLNGTAWARRWGLGPAWAVIMVGLAMAGTRVTNRI